MPERSLKKPLRISVNDVYKGTGSGFCVTGHMETGMAQPGDKVLVMPQNELALIKGIIQFFCPCITVCFHILSKFYHLGVPNSFYRKTDLLPIFARQLIFLHSTSYLLMIGKVLFIPFHTSSTFVFLSIGQTTLPL